MLLEERAEMEDELIKVDGLETAQPDAEQPDRSFIRCWRRWYSGTVKTYTVSLVPSTEHTNLDLFGMSGDAEQSAEPSASTERLFSD